MKEVKYLAFDKTGNKYRYRKLNSYEREHIKNIIEGEQVQILLELMAYFSEYSHPLQMTSKYVQDETCDFINVLTKNGNDN